MRQLLTQIRTLGVLLVSLLGIQLLAVTPALAGASEWINIQVIDGRLLLETEIGGVAGYSMIDTGAEVNAINATFLADADLSFEKGRFIEVSGVFSTQRRYTYKKVPVKVFGTQINFHDLVELEFDTPDIQMLLGASFLKGYIFQFDYPNQRLRLITRDSIDLKKIKNVKSKRDPSGGSPLVRVSLTDKADAWLTMDTGANGGILIDRDLAKRLNWLDTYATEQAKVSGVNSSGMMEHFRVPSIAFGPVKIADVAVAVPAPGEDLQYFKKYVPLGTRIPVGGKSKGLLGYDVLQHFVVTIDYKTGYVHIHAGEKLPEDS